MAKKRAQAKSVSAHMKKKKDVKNNRLYAKAAEKSAEVLCDWKEVIEPVNNWANTISQSLAGLYSLRMKAQNDNDDELREKTAVLAGNLMKQNKAFSDLANLIGNRTGTVLEKDFTLFMDCGQKINDDLGPMVSEIYDTSAELIDLAQEHLAGEKKESIADTQPLTEEELGETRDD